MDVYQELSVEQQFELKVFEKRIRKLSQQEAQELLITLQASMMYQSMVFREILKEAWGIGKTFNVPQNGGK